MGVEDPVLLRWVDYGALKRKYFVDGGNLHEAEVVEGSLVNFTYTELLREAFNLAVDPQVTLKHDARFLGRVVQQVEALVPKGLNLLARHELPS